MSRLLCLSYSACLVNINFLVRVDAASGYPKVKVVFQSGITNLSRLPLTNIVIQCRIRVNSGRKACNRQIQLPIFLRFF